MSNQRTKTELRFKFRLLHSVTVPGGTPVYYAGRARHAYVKPEDVKVDGNRGANSLWEHDTKYYYIWLPADTETEASVD